MLDASTSIELEAFEQIEAVPGRSLLRLTARAAVDPATDTLGLLIDTPDAIHRLDPIPSPPGRSGVLRIAFSAADDLIAGASAYQLELADGSLVELPLPTRGTRKVAPIGALTAAIAALEQQLEAERELRATAEANLERATADALAVARSFEQEAAAREEAERRAERLEAEHGEVVLAELQRQLDAALESERRAREELREARAETDAATMRANQWQAEAERAQGAAGRALDEALRAVPAAPVEEVPADEGGGDSRHAAERTFAERQAANREVLRRARALEREQTRRRAPRRRPAIPKPPRPEGPTGRSGGAA